MQPEVQRIADRIMVEANQNAEAIILEARKSAEMILEKQRELGRRSATERVSYISARARDEADTVRGMVISNAARRASWMVLSEKERLIESVLDDVRAQLVSMTGTKKYASQLEHMIVDGGTALGGGKLEVMLNERDSALSLDFTAMSKTISKNTGKETRFSLSKERVEVTGGAIVKTEDGRIELDNSFDAMLKRCERDLYLRIAKDLFG